MKPKSLVTHAPCGCPWQNCGCHKVTCQHIDHKRGCIGVRVPTKRELKALAERKNVAIQWSLGWSYGAEICEMWFEPMLTRFARIGEAGIGRKRSRIAIEAVLSSLPDSVIK